jgi:methionine-gamma-lyase
VSYDAYHKRKIGKHVLKAETQMMGYGYDPALSEGSLKPPIFLTSTFVFKTAQDGKDFFDYTSGRREPLAGQTSGLVYSRFNNPNLEVLEDRLALWEESETAAVFSSGMAAISTALWTYVRPGDVILMSQPLYGGTETLIEKTFPLFGVKAVSFTEGHDRDAVMHAASRAAALAGETGGRVCLVMTETPANPTNSVVDLALMREVSEHIGRGQSGGRPPVLVDNTFLGPVFQRPLAHGADLVLYSLTKYVGGHSDLVAGGVVGAREVVGPIKKLRGALGTQLDPNTAWMIMRSMETLSLRMHKSAQNAALVAAFLRDHEKIQSVNYLGFLAEDDPRHAVFKRQCESGIDLRIHGQGRRGRGISLARRAASHQVGGESGRHRIADLAPGEHHTLGFAEGDARSDRHHGRADTPVRRHRGRGRLDRGSGRGARCRLTAAVLQAAPHRSGYNDFDRPTNIPRRGPNCGAPTPTPVPSRIS